MSLVYSAGTAIWVSYRAFLLWTRPFVHIRPFLTRKPPIAEGVVSFVNHHGSAPVFLLNPFHPCLSARQRRLRPAGSSARAAALPCHDDLRAGWGWGCGAGGGSGGSKSGRRASARARRPSTGPTTRSAASRRRSVARAAAGISSSEPVASRRPLLLLWSRAAGVDHCGVGGPRGGSAEGRQTRLRRFADEAIYVSLPWHGRV